MAGARITLDWQSGGAHAAFARLAHFGTEGMSLALMDVGEYLLRSHRDRFAAQVAPDGTPWPALSPRYAKRKAKARPSAPMLVYDNFLRGTLSYQVLGGELMLGTNRVYGALQQFGGRPGQAPGPAAVPARAFLGLSAADEDEVLGILGDHFARAAGANP